MPDNEIKLKLTIDGKESIATLNLVETDLNKLASKIRQAGNESRNSGEKMVHSFAQARNLIQGLQETFSVLSGLFATPIDIYVNDEQAKVAFEVLLGNAEKATEMMRELREYSAKTPLEFTTLQDAAKTLLNFNIAAEEILPTLRMLGDISGGNAEKLRSLTLAFAQIQSAGRLMGQDLLQLINAGFNPLQVIAEKTGKSIASLKKEMEAGNISAQMVKQAFIDVTSEGGRFYGILEKQSEKLGGKLSNFRDALVNVQRATGELIGKALAPLLDAITEIINKINKLSPELSGLIGLTSTLTIAMVTLNATGITAVVKNIITGFIPALTKLKVSLATLQISMGPAGWLALGLTAIAGLWFSIAEGEEKAAENLKIYHENYRKLRLAEIEKELNQKDIDSTRKFLLSQERNKLLSELIVRPHTLENTQSTGGSKNEDELKKEFDLLRQKLELRQEHEMNMLKIETDNENLITLLQRQHLEERKKLYEKYGQDITEINYRITENEYKQYKDLTDTNIRGFETAERQKIQIKTISAETLNYIESQHAEDSKKITQDLTEFEKWLYSEEATYRMQLQAQVLNFIAAGFNQYTVMAKLAAMFNAFLKAKEAYLTALAAFPPPFNYIAAGAVAISAAAQIKEIAQAKPPRFQEGGRLKKGEIGFFEGWHDEIIAPEKTFIELFRTELRPQIYAGMDNNNNVLIEELRKMNIKLEEWPNQLSFRLKGYDWVAGYEKNKIRKNKLKF
jgi:tape measure domain-containing protein